MFLTRPLKALALSSILCASVCAQSNTLVPAWARQALEQLQHDGLIHGYPDGSFKGGRTATRYEMAAALYDVWRSVSGQIGELGDRAHPNPPKTDDLKSQIEEVKLDISQLKGMGSDIANLKRLMVEFEPELTQLGLDFEQLRRQLGNISQRVSWLEANHLPFKVSGDLSFLLLGGDSGGGNFGFDSVGRPLGYGRGSLSGIGQNSTRDLTVLHEFSLNLESDEAAKTHWRGTLVSGNMLGTLGQGTTFSGRPYQESASSFYIDSLDVDWKAAHGIRGEAGRIGHVGNPYLLKKPDTTPQFENSRWDNPEWKFDGAKAQVPVGSGFFTGYGGRTGALNSVGGTSIQNLSFGRISLPYIPGGPRPVGLLPGCQTVASIYGADLDVPVGQIAIGLSYEYLQSELLGNNAGDDGRAYGATLSTVHGPLTLSGGYARTDVLLGGTTLIDRRNQAAWAALALDRKSVAASIGYRYIEPLFGGAGDWGRIGMWWNPTDIKGFNAEAAVPVTPHLKFTAHGGWNTGTGIEVNSQRGLSTDDTIADYRFGLERPFGEWKATATFETVDWSLKDRPGFSGGKPTEKWYGLGVRRESEHSLLSLTWLFSAIDSKSVNGFQLGIGSKANGSLLAAQATLKF